MIQCSRCGRYVPGKGEDPNTAAVMDVLMECEECSHVPVSVVIPTFNRPEFLARALASVQAQTWQPAEIIIANDGEPMEPLPGTRHLEMGRASPPSSMYLTWYDAVYRATQPLVAILCDDDWYEPRFLERTMAMLEDDVGYVFTEATIHLPDGTRPNWGLSWGSGYVSSEELGEFFLHTLGIVTPSCCLYRRADVLANLMPGNVPCMPATPPPSGPDHLLALLPLLKYQRVGWIQDSLVHLDGGAQSTTIREMMGEDSGASLMHNYDNARKFFWLMHEAKKQGAWP